MSSGFKTGILMHNFVVFIFDAWLFPPLKYPGMSNTNWENRLQTNKIVCLLKLNIPKKYELLKPKHKQIIEAWELERGNYLHFLLFCFFFSFFQRIACPTKKPIIEFCVPSLSPSSHDRLLHNGFTLEIDTEEQPRSLIGFLWHDQLLDYYMKDTS